MSRECLSAAQCLSKAFFKKKKKSSFLNIAIFPPHLTELFIETSLWLEIVNAKVKKKTSVKCQISNPLGACFASYIEFDWWILQMIFPVHLLITLSLILVK